MSDYNKIMEEIFTSIHLITDRKLKSLETDKTIFATISSVLNASNNLYKITYQNVEYDAYSIKGDYYTQGEDVIVLVPGGVFSNKKLILMRASKTAEAALAAGSITDEVQAQIDEAIQKAEESLELIDATNTVVANKTKTFYDLNSAAKEPFALSDGDTWFIPDLEYKIKIARRVQGVTSISASGTSITISTPSTSDFSLGDYLVLRGTTDKTNADGVWAVTQINPGVSLVVSTDIAPTTSNLLVNTVDTLVLKWTDVAFGAQALDTSTLSFDGTTIFYNDAADIPDASFEGDTWFVQDQDNKIKTAKKILNITDITAIEPSPNHTRVTVFTTDTSNLSVGEKIFISKASGAVSINGAQEITEVNSDNFKFTNIYQGAPLDPVGDLYNPSVQILYWDDMPLGTSAIEDGAIVASKIYVGTITGDKIAANTIRAINIEADAITADRIAIGNPSNILFNPGFEIEMTGYELNTPGWDFADDSSIETDVNRGRILKTVAGASSKQTIATQFIAVQPTQKYMFSGHYKTSVGATGSCSFGYKVYNKNKVEIGSYSVSSLTSGGNVTQWNHFTTSEAVEKIETIPTDGYYIKPVITVNAGSGSFYFDDLTLMKAVETSFIADLAITNAKIGSLNAGKIQTGTMVIGGSNLRDPSISIQDSNDSERIKISTLGIKGKNVSGTETFSLDINGNLAIGTEASGILSYTNGTLTVPAANITGNLTIGGSSGTSAIIGKSGSVETFRLSSSGALTIGASGGNQLTYDTTNGLKIAAATITGKLVASQIEAAVGESLTLTANPSITSLNAAVDNKLDTSQFTGSNIVSQINIAPSGVVINGDKVSINGSTIDISANSSITSKVSTNGVISAINQSAEAITISASKINISGAVTLSSWLDPNDSTKINGANIKTGTISADRIGTGVLSTQGFSPDDSSDPYINIYKDTIVMNPIIGNPSYFKLTSNPTNGYIVFNDTVGNTSSITLGNGTLTLRSTNIIDLRAINVQVNGSPINTAVFG